MAGDQPLSFMDQQIERSLSAILDAFVQPDENGGMIIQLKAEPSRFAPLALQNRPCILVRISGGNRPKLIGRLEVLPHEAPRGMMFRYRFVTEQAVDVEFDGQCNWSDVKTTLIRGPRTRWSSYPNPFFRRS